MTERADHLTALARAIVERTPVDWEQAEASSASAAERDAVRELKVIAQLAAFHRGASGGNAGEIIWGPLHVLAPLGHGTYGDVYRALDMRLDREVALKLLRGDEAMDEAARVTIEEARLLARVQHPNVVTIYGADRIDGRAGLWMELVRGRTLEQLLREDGPFSATDVAAIGLDVCRALAAVHAAGLLHRDVKAQNVMRDAGGRHVLMDFGAGRLAEASRDSDLTGTPLYLAPEVLNGEPASPRSDVYSVGVLLFHLATGTYPVRGRTIADLRVSHAHDDRADIASIRSGMPAPLAALISRALSPSPVDRFDTADAMADAAGRLVERAGSTRSRLRLAHVVAVTAFAVAAALGSWLVAARVLNPDTGPRTRLLWDDATDLGGTTTRDGRLLAFADWTTGNVGIRDLVSARTAIVTKSGFAARGQAEHTAFSPDGRSIAYAWLDWSRAERDRAVQYELRVVGSDGSGDRTVWHPQPHVYLEPHDWSPDGEWIAAAVTAPSGWSVERIARDGSRRTTLATLTEHPDDIRVSPDGRWLAFHQERDASVRVLPADGLPGAPNTVAAATRLLAWTADCRLLFTRERNGSAALFALPMAEGRPIAQPVQLESVLDVGPALGMTSAGSLIYGKTKSSGRAAYAVRTYPGDAIAVSIDPATGEIGPERVTEPVISYGLSGLWGGVRYAPEGDRVLYVPAQQTILIRSSAGARKLIPQLERLGCVDWAADGRSLIVSGARKAGEPGVYRVDPDTGAAELLVAGAPGPAFVLSRDGRTFFRSSGGEPHVVVTARDLHTGAERQIRTLDKTVMNLSLSRDGRMLAIAGLRTLELVDVMSGSSLLRRTTADDERFAGGDWSPDARIFYASVSIGTVHPRGELWTIPVDGAAPTRHSLSASMRGAWVRPDGKELSMVRADERQQVWIIENFLPPRR